jgi:hypothetical protein
MLEVTETLIKKVRRAQAAGWALAPAKPPRYMFVEWTGSRPPDLDAEIALGRLVGHRTLPRVREVLLADIERRRAVFSF